jgi:hypothetical protein
MAERGDVIATFLAGAGWSGAQRAPLAGDASARRYERLTLGARTAVLMDAPPEAGQDVRRFRDLADHLRGAGLSAPRLYAHDDDAGLLLLEDFGDGIFARLAEDSQEQEKRLYLAATDMLLALGEAEIPPYLAAFTPPEMAMLIAPVFDFYAAPLGRDLPATERAAITALLERALTDHVPPAKVLSLRDCHAANLMHLPERSGTAQVGLLDFQDAVAAHPAYDLVSLLQDARRDVPRDLAEAAIARHAARSGTPEAEFRAAYAAMGVQRQLRILGVFGKLSLMQGKPGYVRLMPRVWRHLQTCLSEPPLAELAEALRVLPRPDHLDRLRPHAA